MTPYIGKTLLTLIMSVGFDTSQITFATFSKDSARFSYLRCTQFTMPPLPHAPVYRQTCEVNWTDCKKPDRWHRFILRDVKSGREHTRIEDEVEVVFAPDSRKLLVWTPESISIIELDRPNAMPEVVDKSDDAFCVSWVDNCTIGFMRSNTNPNGRLQNEIVKITLSNGKCKRDVIASEDMGALVWVTWSPTGRYVLIHPSSKNPWRLVDLQNRAIWKFGKEWEGDSAAAFHAGEQRIACVSFGNENGMWDFRAVTRPFESANDLTDRLRKRGENAASLIRSRDERDYKGHVQIEEKIVSWNWHGDAIILLDSGKLVSINDAQVSNLGPRAIGARLLPIAYTGLLAQELVPQSGRLIILDRQLSSDHEIENIGLKWKAWYPPVLLRGLISPNLQYGAKYDDHAKSVSVINLKQFEAGDTKQ